MNQLKKIGKVSFPKPQGVIVNVMPIVVTDPSTNPFPWYQNLINQCGGDWPGVAYLTITEGWVEPGESQRRHVEAPAGKTWGGGAEALSPATRVR